MLGITLLEMLEPILHILLIDPQRPVSNISYLRERIIWDIDIKFVEQSPFCNEGELNARDPEVFGVGVSLVVYE